MKKLFLSIICILMLLNLSIEKVYMETKDDTNFPVVGERIYETQVYTTLSEDGDVVELDIKEAESEVYLQQFNRMNTPSLMNDEEIINGVVNFKTKLFFGDITYYTDYYSNKRGYINGYYGADAAFLGYNADYTKVKFMMAGAIGWVNTSEVEVLDYDNEDVVRSVSYYVAKNGKLYHYVTLDVRTARWDTVTIVGLPQTYMNEKEVMYSYDGHYFYKDYATMIFDYKNNIRDHSINKNQPYYNYYQYLSHRSKTNLTASMLDSYLNNILNSVYPNSTSKMKNMGQYFIEYQNTYGANALLMYAVAANESAWGTSYYAVNNNNLFGHQAYDSDTGSASVYNTPQDCIYDHARWYVSAGYLDPKDYSGRYFGGHLGDKASGMNVSYASDPYWGEKAASFAWRIYDSYQQSKDAFKYTIAIKEDAFNLNFRKYATSASTLLYSTGLTSHFPFIILDESEGESISGSNIWYRLQSDSQLNSTRDAILQDDGVYSFSNDYVYVHSSFVKIVNKDSYEDNTMKEDHWEYINGKWYYFKDGNMYTGWLQLIDVWYYLNAEGVMVTGWQKINGNWFYFETNGEMVTGFKTVDGLVYYMNNNGVMLTGWQNINGSKYYFNPSGDMVTEKKEIDGKIYYFGSDGKLLDVGLGMENGKTYYLLENGIKAKGWKEVGNDWYYFGTDGFGTNGWLLYYGQWHYIENGKMCTEFVKTASGTYYLGLDGIMKTNWQFIDNTWYYFNADGVMMKGWQKISNVWYYMDKDGKMLTGIQKIDGKTYHLASSGAMSTGWVEVGSDWYYFNSDGSGYDGWLKYYGQWYFMKGGKMATEWLLSADVWYYLGNDGIMVTGWQRISNVWYYFNTSGAMLTGTQFIDGKTYYFDASGAWVG